MSDTDDTEQRTARAGFGFALSAYVMWGLSPLYWQWFETGPLEIVAHRTIWATLALLPFVLAANPRLTGLFTAQRIFWGAVGALLIGSNWLVFIWAVSRGQVLEVSLGYFMGPLMNVALGVIFLRERLRPAQIAAVALAVVGVAAPIIASGHVPAVALFLGASFSLYALVRKRLDVGGATGLFLESLLLTPFGIAGVLWFETSGTGRFLEWSWQPVLLISAGVIFTAGVLQLFILGARRLTLSTMGLIQFIAPTIQFVIGLIMGEAFPPARAIAFVFIWVGLAIYAADMLRHERARALQRRASPVG